MQSLKIYKFQDKKMTIDSKLLEKLQRLGSVELSKEQQEKAIKNLNDIVDFVENINKLKIGRAHV